MAANTSATPIYGTATLHPDGAIYPSGANLAISQILDGQSHTIIIIETIDDSNSRWMIGSECVLTGLPGKSPTAPNTVCSVPRTASPTAPYNFYAPQYFDNTWGDTSGVTTHGLRTFLMYDCSPTGTEAGKYAVDGDPGSSWTTADRPGSTSYTGPNYGPSSGHPAVVIAGLGDNSVMPINKRVDAANFFFLITKANNDPFNQPN